MERVSFSDILGTDISMVNKEFDDRVFSMARVFRRTIAKQIGGVQNQEFWASIDINQDMLQPVLERKPFENTVDVLQFNVYLTEVCCKKLLDRDDISILEKIAMYSNIIELGAREFIDPLNNEIIYKHLGAAKETGYFFTPASVAIRMVALSIESNPSAKRVFDPSTGAGVFLAYHILFNTSITEVKAIELDKRTAKLAEQLLVFLCRTTGRQINVQITCGDFFAKFEELRSSDSFDTIIMNPPYGNIKFLFSDLTDQSTIAGLSDDEIEILSEKLRKSTMDYSAQLRAQFKPYGFGKGTLEYSKLFMSAALELIKDDGVIVAITPSSWLGDESSFQFRKTILEAGKLREVWIIPEMAKLFKGVNQPTAITVFGKRHCDTVVVSNPVMRIEQGENLRSSLNLVSILNVSGEKKKFPKCDESALRILNKLQDLSKIRNISEVVNARGELDLTQYKSFISQKDTGHRLIRGDHIRGCFLVDASESDKAGYVDYSGFMTAIASSPKVSFIERSRIAIPQCSYLQKKERIEAAIVPPGSILGNSCNYLSISSEKGHSEKEYYYWAVINSTVIEWQFRIFSYNNHVSNKEIDELACIAFDDVNKKYITELLSSMQSISPNSLYQIDAIIAHIFGLSEEEYAFILTSISAESEESYLREYCEMEKKQNQDIPQHTMPSLSSLDKEMISYVEPGGNWTSIPETVPSKRLEQIREMAKNRGMVRTTYYSRLKYTQPAYTISTYFNRPGNGANIHPWEDRTLSCREAARLQSFPDSFIFEGNEAAVRTQIGNAVPPLLGFAIGKAISKKTSHPLKFCDIFAGAGGLSYGLELAGFTGVAGLEINKSAAKTFSRNHNPAMQTIVGDINEDTVQDQLIKSVSQTILPDEDWVLVGGPPCQGFSTAGYRDPNDIRNKLVDSYLKLIQRLNPTIVVMENVPGILSMSKGQVVEGVFQALRDNGYTTINEPWVVDAERYGVPQMRKRVIIVASKKPSLVPDYPVPVFSKCLGRREDGQLSMAIERYPITVGEALIGLPALMPINSYYPKDANIDPSYSQWCQGQITVEQLLESRGKI